MAFPYVKANNPWRDANSATGGGNETTPLTAANLDQIEAGIASLSDILALIDAKGDLLVGTADNAFARLAVGAANKVLATGASSALSYATIVDAMIDAAAAITISKLAGYPSDATKFLRGDGSWAAAGTPSLTAALPGSPSDGDEIILVDSTSAPTYAWHLRYISAKASNKWQFIGGSSLYAEVAASASLASTAYTALASAGPTVTLPIAGDYMVENGFESLGVASSPTVFMSYDIGGTGAVDADSVNAGGVTSGLRTSGSRSRFKAGLTAVALTSKYRGSTASSITLEKRWLRVTPVAIGG